MTKKNVLLLFAAVTVSAFLSGCQTRDTAKAESAPPSDWAIQKTIIKASENNGDLATALGVSERAAEADPDNADAKLWKARLLMKAGRLEQAEDLLAEIADHQDPLLLVEQGRMALLKNDAAGARESETRALAQIPDSRDAKTILAVSLDVLGEHIRAQEIYRSLLANKEEASVRYNYGRSLALSGDSSRAIETLYSLSEREDMPQAKMLLAELFIDKKDFETARRILRRDGMPDADIERVFLASAQVGDGGKRL